VTQRPRWQFLEERYDLTLVLWSEHPAFDPPLSSVDALRALDAHLHGASGSLAIRTFEDRARTLRARFGAMLHIRRSDRAVVAEALDLRLLRAKRWRNTRIVAPPRDTLDTDALDALPLTPSRTNRTWIEIVLTDMEGNPQPGRRSWIKLTDGRVREGALDQSGRAYLGDLDPGECEIC
jgi:hypothetical protein